ncbi:Phosphoenolpyruvate/pyruvate domain-containing protein [Aspergillus ellipticus CBS 707.79]|uniref:3-methyl-2-oxobutanoate hydroxymethyltransferase n=1 Tax=Aspergillus ellipticus CBS 707.79 TaxID=1448320 RepID=A0A319CVJ3_9EURO|nr:Phosphoenolpyruvate/pyruvate domain-containing protein [Aspergillus ellipticus CBS 707.79]
MATRATHAASSHSTLSATPPKKITIETLRALHQRNEPIAALTAYDYPSALAADLPMGTYEITPSQAISSAQHLLRHSSIDALKLEADGTLAPTIHHLTRSGIPVMAHIGLTPQRQHMLSGFRVQGKTASSAMRLLEDALAL